MSKMDVAVETAWSLAVALEPRLQALLEEARSYHKQRTRIFCANRVYYGHVDSPPSLKARLSELVGTMTGRRCKHPALATREVYDFVTDVVYNALPDCRGGCSCA